MVANGSHHEKDNHDGDFNDNSNDNNEDIFNIRYDNKTVKYM